MAFFFSFFVLLVLSCLTVKYLQRKNWKTSKGTVPANLDLFLTLEEEVAKHEAKNVKVGSRG